MINRNYNNKYVNLKSINNLYSKYELSRRLNAMIRDDKDKVIKRVKVVQSNNPSYNRKCFFVHSKHIDYLIRKQPKKSREVLPYFVTIRVLRANYINPIFYEQFISEIKKHKKTKKLEYCIPEPDVHLHFKVTISKNELVKIIKKIIKQNYFSILKFSDLHLTETQKNFFLKTNSNEPILIIPINDEIGINNYMAKQGAIKIK